MQHNDEDLVEMRTMRWMQDIVQLFKKKEKISHTNFISRSKIPMGFRNTDEVKHKFKRACTTTETQAERWGKESVRTSEGGREAKKKRNAERKKRDVT